MNWEQHVESQEKAQEWKFLTRLHDDLAHLYFEYPWSQQNTRLLLNQLLERMVREYLRENTGTDKVTRHYVQIAFSQERHGDSRVLKFFREWKNAQDLLDKLIQKESEKQNGGN